MRKKYLKITELGNYESNPGTITAKREEGKVRIKLGFLDGFYVELSKSQQRKLAYFLLNRKQPKHKK